MKNDDRDDEPCYDDDFLGYVVAHPSQYDSTCRALAEMLLSSRALIVVGRRLGQLPDGDPVSDLHKFKDASEEDRRAIYMRALRDVTTMHDIVNRISSEACDQRVRDKASLEAAIAQKDAAVARAVSAEVERAEWIWRDFGAYLREKGPTITLDPTTWPNPEPEPEDR